MSLQIDDDLAQVLYELTNGRTTDALWATQTILKLVMDNQQLRKRLQVTHALNPEERDTLAKYREEQRKDEMTWRAQQKAQLPAHNYVGAATGANQAAKAPHEIIDKYLNTYPEIKNTLIYPVDKEFEATTKGKKDVGS